MKKVIFTLSILLSILFSGAFSGVFATESTTTSKYTKEIDACIDANKEGRAKSIESYICPIGTLSSQQIAFQVIMSIEFQKLDDEIKTILKAIYAGNNKDIGQLAATIKNYFDDLYPKKYKDICNKTVQNEAALYFQSKGESLVTDDDIQSFLYGQSNNSNKLLSCQELVDRKLKAYKESAWLLGEAAVVNSFKNDKHTYMRKLKDQYEKFLNKWTVYIGQLSIIKDKWTSKTKVTQ